MELGGFFPLRLLLAEEVGDGEGAPLPEGYDTTGEIELCVEGEEAEEQRAWGGSRATSAKSYAPAVALRVNVPRLVTRTY